MATERRNADRAISRSTDVAAPADRVFALVADPHQHRLFDGSGSLRGTISGPRRLELGSRFGMRMRIGLPYRIANTVVEFENERLIAWRHFHGHRWRYQLEPLDDGHTRVTETFDWSRARFPRALELFGAPRVNTTSIEETLPRLKQIAEAQTSRSTR